MKFIGLTGPAGSGKSTIARILCDNHGFTELSFAGPIKHFIRRLTGLSEMELEERKEDPHPLLCGRSPRHAMQTLGTEWGRNLIGHELWIKCLKDELTAIVDANTVIPDFVISDVRFPNEAQWIRERGELWHITRPGKIGVNVHTSELGIGADINDFILDNDCDLDELSHRIDLHVGAVAR